MKYIFLIALCAMIFSSVYLIRSGKLSRKALPFYAGFVPAVILGIADLFGALGHSPFHKSFMLMGAVTVLLILLHIKKWNDADAKVYRRISKAVLAVMVIELTLFQVPALPTNFLSKYKTTVLHLSQADIKGDSYDSIDQKGHVTIHGSNSVTFEFNNIGVPVGSVKTEAEFNGRTEYMDVWLDIQDETVSTIRDNIATGRIVRDVPSSDYIHCSMSGKVGRMSIELKCPKDQDSVVIKNIMVNEPVPFHVSFIRFLIIAGLAVLTIAVAGLSHFQRTVEDGKRLFKLCVIETTVVSLALAVIMAMAIAPDGGIKRFFKTPIGDQMTQQLVESFENGRLDIDARVSDSLLKLENPYQWDARDGITYEWDHLFYDGKYYSYYGIAPVILLYLPFHKLTGSFMTQNSAILVFTIIGLIFLSMAYYTFIKRFFSRIPVGCAVCAHIIMVLSCGIWFNLCQPIFYEAAIGSGFAAMTAAVYFLLSSGVFGKEKLSLPRTALSSLFFGIAAMSRPTLAVYAISAYIIYALNIKNADLKSDGSKDKKRRVKYALCGALPLAVLGLTQMAYNYARFGSPLDFGIQYSLTINDFTHSEFHLSFVFIGFYYYLIAPPMLKSTYPFIVNDLDLFGANGYYYHCPETAAGVMFLAPPAIGYLFTRKALRLLPDRRTRIRAILGAGVPFVLMPLIIIASIWESGYAVRYIADFAWEMLFGALCILFFLYDKYKNEIVRKLFKIFMALSTAVAVIVNVPMVYGVMCPRDGRPVLSELFSNVFAFWK